MPMQRCLIAQRCSTAEFLNSCSSSSRAMILKATQIPKVASRLIRLAFEVNTANSGSSTVMILAITRKAKNRLIGVMRKRRPIFWLLLDCTLFNKKKAPEGVPAQLQKLHDAGKGYQRQRRKCGNSSPECGKTAGKYQQTTECSASPGSNKQGSQCGVGKESKKITEKSYIQCGLP